MSLDVTDIDVEGPPLELWQPLGFRVLTEPARQTLQARFGGAVQHLHSAYFAMVIANGNVGIGCELTGLRPLAVALSWLNVPIFVVHWTLTLARALVFPQDFIHDLIDHKRGPGFFTIVAGTSVLGWQQIIKNLRKAKKGAAL